MPGPFYNAIKGTTAGTPGTGAFTPNAASAGFRAWSTVPTGWIGMVRFEDGSDWELSWCYWNGTTLSRGTNQLFASSTGSVLTLTSAATAAMIVDANEVQPSFALGFRGWVGIPAGTTPAAFGVAAVTQTGTAAGANISNTNDLVSRARVQLTSATTANAQAGWSAAGSARTIVNTGAGIGGYEIVVRFGVTQLPTGPRLVVGAVQATHVGDTTEPSAKTSRFAIFGKDSTDTNIQLITNDGTSTGTKIDTGIPLEINKTYEAVLWIEPGSTTVNALLINLTDGTIFYTQTSTDVPPHNTLLEFNAIGGLSSTTGTAIIMQMISAFIRCPTS